MQRTEEWARRAEAHYKSHIGFSYHFWLSCNKCKKLDHQYCYFLWDNN